MKNSRQSIIFQGLVLSCGLMLINCNKPESRTFISREKPISNNNKAGVVQAPFKKTQIGFSSFVVAPDSSVTVTISDGSKIHISANSFIDSLGRKTMESVVLNYRAFKDPAEILASGIPMSFTNKTGRINKCFQSAGMFELQAKTESGKSVFIRNENPITVDLASNIHGDGYSNFFLDTQKGEWIYSGEEMKTINAEKLNLKKQIERLKESVAFAGKKYFVLNNIGLLDVYFDDDYTKVYEYITEKNRPLPNKLLKYGIESKNISSNNNINLNKNVLPASMIVWENLQHINFPKWTKNKLADIRKINGDTYEIAINGDHNKSEFFKTKVKAVMSIKSMLRFNPERWAGNYKEVLAEIRKEEATLAKMGDFYRTLEINAFGIYNCDKFYSNPESFSVITKIILPPSKNNFKPEKVFYVSKRDKISIDYKLKDFMELRLCADNSACLYTVLENDMLAQVDASQLNKITKQNRSEQKIELKFFPLKKINSIEDIKHCIGI